MTELRLTAVPTSRVSMKASVVLHRVIGRASTRYCLLTTSDEHNFHGMLCRICLKCGQYEMWLQHWPLKAHLVGSTGLSRALEDEYVVRIVTFSPAVCCAIFRIGVAVNLLPKLAWQLPEATSLRHNGSVIVQARGRDGTESDAFNPTTSGDSRKGGVRE